MDNVARLPYMTDAEKARYKAEAKVIMASKYFDGIHNFGGLPIVDHALAADEVLEKPRSTIEETVTFDCNISVHRSSYHQPTGTFPSTPR